MKNTLLLLLLCIGSIRELTAQTREKCCDNATCRAKAVSYAQTISALTKTLGKYQPQDSANEQLLTRLKQKNPQSYQDFIRVSRQTATFINDTLNGTCFSDALPDDEANNVFQWLVYMNRQDISHPDFPSSEFCGGLEKRFELSQGAANIFSNQVAYLGTLRGYLSYTFAGAGQCGGRLRVMAGPAVFLRGNTFYTTLSTRLAVRVTDISVKKIPVGVGNLNAYTEYNTSFVHFNQVALGAELQLGPFGLNLSVNNELKSARIGFAVGIVLFHQPFKKRS
ncbi:hypothetical protein HHL17_23285 [Chitinophaga sp. G-6-1-13]|uniref:Uncharacterized protein n=1 Tax=Chitinophaga fulva TaxID=2728842 RepID=A0A848GSP6_9BACT|nr:hypothetical protein [Chitinophaga fulva]NML40142.1 hypothetical protein [Chitinophaga fulva]